MPLVPIIKGFPVLLPAHDDSPDFGDTGKHYHIDYRYCNDIPKQERVLFSDDKPKWEMCHLVRENYQLDNESIMLLMMLTDKYYEGKLNCGRCPHKGLLVINDQCPGHGLAFYNNKVDTDLFVQLIDIPEDRKSITRKQMKLWVKQGYGCVEFKYYKNSLSVGKSITGIEIVTKQNRSLAKILFKTKIDKIPINGCNISVIVR